MEETITTEQQAPLPGNGLLLTSEAQYYLNEGAGWAKFLSVVGFIFCGFILLGAVFAGSIFGTLARMNPNQANAYLPGVGGIISIVYGLTALLYFFPCLYLFQFSNRAKNAVRFGNTADITSSISKLKSFFKFVGILTIISLVFVVLAVVGLIVGLSAMSSLR